MIDFVNRVIGLFLAFILLVIAPFVIYSLNQDSVTKRLILNEMSSFTEKVADTGKLTDEEIADFYLGTSTNGVLTDVTIERYAKIINPDGSGGTYVTYSLVDNVQNWNQGDLIKVRVKAVDYTGGQKLMWQLMSLYTDKIDFSLTRMVRQ